MNYKFVFRLFSSVFVILGLLLTVTGAGTLSYFGVTEIPEINFQTNEVVNFWKTYSFLRISGAAIIAYGLLIGFLAYIEGEKDRKRASIGAAVGLLVLTVIALTQQIALWETIAGWIITAVFLIAFAVFAFLSLKKGTVKEIK